MENNKETEKNRFKGFKDFEISKVKRLYEWAKIPMEQEIELRSKKNFYLYFKEYDERKNINFNNYFPEFNAFFNDCKELNVR